MARDTRYQGLVQRAEFQSTYGLLRHYADARSQDPAQIELPPPPASVKCLPTASPLAAEGRSGGLRSFGRCGPRRPTGRSPWALLIGNRAAAGAPWEPFGGVPSSDAQIRLLCCRSSPDLRAANKKGSLAILRGRWPSTKPKVISNGLQVASCFPWLLDIPCWILVIRASLTGFGVSQSFLLQYPISNKECPTPKGRADS